MKKPLQRLPRWYYPAALAAGVISVAAFAPLGWYPLSCISLALLYTGIRHAPSARQAALLGFVWGLGAFLTGVSWVYVSMHDVGGMPLPMAAAMTLLLCFVLSLYPALAAWLTHKLRHHRTLDCLSFAAAWALSEWLRGTLFTGFPWLAIGYAHSTSPLGAYAPLLGSYGVGLITALIAALLATFAAHPKRGQVAITSLTVLILGGLGLSHIHWTQPQGQPFSVSLLQGNIPQSMKWVPERLPLSVNTYASLASANPAALTVLPETAIPLLWSQIPGDYLHALGGKGHLLIGAAMPLTEEAYVNAAVLVAPDLASSNYQKRHLVPFGEFVPPGFRWFFDFIQMPMSDFSAGKADQPPLAMGELLIAPNICYEDLFGEELIAAMPAANLLINLSNTAWFGDSLAQPQHLQISQMRARETGRMMLRATNTGMTAAIGPDGQVIAALPAFTKGALQVQAQGYSGSTPYVRWGNVPLLVLLAAILIRAWRKIKAPTQQG